MVTDNLKLASLESIKALVLGDLMLDKYTIGQVTRISPEAPVAILNVETNHSLPGGAGNVVINLKALDAEVTVLGRIGLDLEGDELLSELRGKGALSDYVTYQVNYPTITKNRLIASSQQLLRIDREKMMPLDLELEQQVLIDLERLIPKMQVVAVSDYGKGFLTDKILGKAIELAALHKVPLVVDPKGLDFKKYKGAFLIKPNLKEAYLAAKLTGAASLEEVAKAIFLESKSQYLLITRSEKGMTLFDSSLKRIDFPVHSKEVKDVTGAGDTVLSVLALALANQLELKEAIDLANVAASIAIEHIGCAAVTKGDLAKRLKNTLSLKDLFFVKN